MKKQKILGLLCAAVLAATLSACGSADTASSAPESDNRVESVSLDTSESVVPAESLSEPESVSAPESVAVVESSSATSSKATSTTSHKHSYTSNVTTAATCGKAGVRTYTCACGATYTESIPQTANHSWQSATCTAPKTCSVCGAVEGSATEHRYKTYDDCTCWNCGQQDPRAAALLAQCSLEMPALPAEYARYNSSKVQITNLTYEWKISDLDKGTVYLHLYFSGTKTYDKEGAGHSESCWVGEKLYDAAGNVVTDNIFMSPAVATGESFANKDGSLTSSSLPAGHYRLELTNYG